MKSGKTDTGRGVTAVTDMKARIDALRAAGTDLTGVIDALWSRSRDAELGEGYVYEYAERPQSLRQDRERRQ